MASNLQADFSLTEASNMFKIMYGTKSDTAYNAANVLLGTVPTFDDFVGKRKEFPVPLSFQGGVGSGSIPEANVSNYEDVTFTASKMYAVARYDREAIKAASNDRGAFVRGTAEITRATVESWARNMSRALFGSGDGSLGTIDTGGVTDNGGGNYTLTISAATWKEANFEERDFVNIEAGNTDLFEVESVDPDNTAITVQRSSAGTQVPVAGDVIFMQGSENNDPEGLKGILDATSGSLYGIPVARRWQGYQQAETSGVTIDKLNKAMLQVEKRSGKVPDTIVTSYTQYQRILDQMQDQKRYNRADRTGTVNFTGVEFMSTMGPVPIFPDRMCEDDRVYVVNSKFIEIHRRPGFGWFDDDGTIFLRVDGEDVYEARYGGYVQVYIAPFAHGVITGLTV